jgi:predicted nucleic acid-binding Zn ribbon protein
MERAARMIGKLKLCASPDEFARAAWPVAVGPRIAAHAAAAGLEGNRLVVEVEDAVWQRQLQTLAPQILARLEQVVGPGLVGGLTFRPMRPRRMPQREERAARPADEADAIPDRAMRRLYKAARRKATA